jgi:hypothetical protein
MGRRFESCRAHQGFSMTWKPWGECKLTGRCKLRKNRPQNRLTSLLLPSGFLSQRSAQPLQQAAPSQHPSLGHGPRCHACAWFGRFCGAGAVDRSKTYSKLCSQVATRSSADGFSPLHPKQGLQGSARLRDPPAQLLSAPTDSGSHPCHSAKRAIMSLAATVS